MDVKLLRLPGTFKENILLLITNVLQSDSKPDWSRGNWKSVFEDLPFNVRHPSLTAIDLREQGSERWAGTVDRRSSLKDLESLRGWMPRCWIYCSKNRKSKKSMVPACFIWFGTSYASVHCNQSVLKQPVFLVWVNTCLFVQSGKHFIHSGYLSHQLWLFYWPS